MKLTTANGTEFELERYYSSYTSKEIEKQEFVRHCMLEFNPATTTLDSLIDEIRNKGFENFSIEYDGSTKTYSGFHYVSELAETQQTNYAAIRLQLSEKPVDEPAVMP